MRLIDADALKKAFESWKSMDDYYHNTDCDDIPFSEAYDLIDNAPTVERPTRALARLDDNSEVKIELLRPHGKCKTCKYYHPYYEQLTNIPRGDGYCVIARMTPEGMTTINCNDEFSCSDYQKIEGGGA